MEGTHTAKVCPLLAAFGSKDQVSSGSSWASRCKGADCAWWDAERNHCAIAVIATDLTALLSAGKLPALDA